MIDRDCLADGVVPELTPDVRAALRSHRHDLAGRVHVLFAALDLIDENSEYVPADISEATQLLQDVKEAWHRELKRFDALLDNAPRPLHISGIELSELLERELPEGYWSCDPDALTRAVKHGNKALGRTPFRDMQFRTDVRDGVLQLTLSSGLKPEHLQLTRPALAFPGDLDAAIAEAECRLAGVDVLGGLDGAGALLVFRVAQSFS
jgi:hypothetical protein